MRTDTAPISDSTPTTRRYARTLNDAFRHVDGVDYAQAFDKWPRVPRHRSPVLRALATYALAVVIGVTFAVAIVYYS